MDVEPLRLETGEAVGNELKLLRTASRWSNPFFRPSRSGCWSRVRCAGSGELLVLFKERVFPVSPKNVVAVLDLFDDGASFHATSCPAGRRRSR